jgi:uncharacterized membrane protein
LIGNYLQILGILIPVIAALLAAFWKLINKADDNRTKYQQDVLAVRGTVVSGDVIPQLVKLIENVETERELNSTETIENIIGRTTHGHSLKQIVNRINELNDLDILLSKTVDSCFSCAYDMLLASAIVGICILWLFVDQYWSYFVTIALFAGFVVLSKVVYDILAYSRNIHKFIRRHNEMQLGRNQT